MQGHTTSDHQLIGSVVATVLVVVVTVQVALDTAYWTVFNHVTIWGSLVFYFGLQYFYNFVIGGSYVGSLTKAMGEATFWFTLVLSIVTLMIPVVAWRFYFIDRFPTLSDSVRLKQRLSAIRYVTAPTPVVCFIQPIRRRALLVSYHVKPNAPKLFFSRAIPSPFRPSVGQRKTLVPTGNPPG